jgi:hypothetical protein
VGIDATMRRLLAFLMAIVPLAGCGSESSSIDAGFERFFELQVEREFERTLAGLDEVDRSDLCEILGAGPSCDVDGEGYIEVVRDGLTWGAALETAEQLCATTADELKTEVIRLLATESGQSPVRPDFDRIVPAEETVEEHPPELRYHLTTLATGCPDRLGDVASADHEQRYIDHAEQFRTED